MPSPGAKLRALIDKGEHFVCGDTYSAITGRICEYVGFPAAYLGGHACSAFHYAVPDNGVYSQVEQIEQASRIANVMSIPLIADADTLGGLPASAYQRSGTPASRSADEVSMQTSGQAAAEDVTVLTAGTPGYLGLFTDSANLGNSVLFQSGNAIEQVRSFILPP